MKTNKLHFYILFFLQVILINNSYAEELKLTFLSEPLIVNYDKKSIIKYRVKASDKSITQYCTKINKTNHGLLKNELLRVKNQLNLNDWIYYKLILEVVDHLANTRNENYKTTFIWFLLRESGYNTKLVFSEKDILLLIHSNDKIFDKPQFTS